MSRSGASVNAELNRWSVIGWAIFGAAICLVVGCDFVDTFDAPIEQNESWYCIDDSSCEPMSTCQAGICAELVGDELEVALSIWPSSQSPDLARVDIPTAAVTLGERLPDIVVSDRITVSGEVTFDAPRPDDRLPVIGAEVTFRRLLDGLVPRNAYNTTTNRRGRFDLDVPAGRYEITVIPQPEDDEPAPPSRFFDVLLDGESPIVMVLPPSAHRQVIEGRLVRQDQAGELIGLGGARVSASSIDRRHLATASFTDDDGYFKLSAPLDARSWRLEARPGPESDHVWPKVTFEPIDISQPTELERLFIAGRWGQPVSVSGSLANAGGSDTLQWQVLLRLLDGALDPDRSPPETDPNHVYPEDSVLIVRGGSNREGAFEVAALPGQYSLLATPLERGGPNAIKQSVQVSSAGVQLGELETAPHQTLSGVVESPSGEPAFNVRVSVEPVSLLGTSIEVYDVQPALMRQEVFSDLEGHFELELPDGDYILSLEPSERTGWARQERRWSVGEERGDDIRRERLQPSGVVWGRALNSAGRPVVGAEVTAYPVGQFQTPLASALTDSSGFYRLVLPATLSRE